MAFISKEELDRLTSEENNLAERLKVSGKVSPEDDKKKNPIGRFETALFKNNGVPKEEKTQLTRQERVAAGIISVVAGKGAASEAFGISASYAEMLGRGQLSGGSDPEDSEKLKAAIYEGLASIRNDAQGRLLKVLALIDDAALEAIKDSDKARTAAQIANHLMNVVDRTINKSNSFDQRAAHIHLYAPEQRVLSSFSVKTINAELVERNIDVGEDSPTE